MKEGDYAIMDDMGVIFSGSENEMNDMMFSIKHGGPARPLNEWDGDLVLVEIREVWNG